MIAELFYPKELKEIIADLRTKGDLNEEALSAFHYQLYLRVIGFPVIGCLFVLIENHIISWIIAAFLVFSIWIDIYFFYKNYLASYILGLPHKAIVEKIVFMNHFRKKLLCRNTTSQEKVATNPIRKDHYGTECPLVGDEIYYYQDEAQKYKAMPDIKSVKKKYCLSKSLYEGVEL